MVFVEIKNRTEGNLNITVEASALLRDTVYAGDNYEKKLEIGFITIQVEEAGDD